MAIIGTITYLHALPRPQHALFLLRRVASIVKPIMVAHGYKIITFAEMFPKEAGLLGLNYNKGVKLCIRLRPQYDPSKFLPEEDLIATMLHELTHNVYGPHDEKFYGHLRKLEDEYYALKAKGWNGEGFLGPGNMLGGRNIDAVDGLGLRGLRYQRQHAVAAMEQRLERSKGSGQRLGGGIVNNGRLSQQEIIAQAAERRQWDQKHCSGDHTFAGEVGGTSIGGLKESLEEDAWLKEQIKEIYKGWWEDENGAIVIDDDDEPKRPATTGYWNCRMCTLVNPATKSRCEVCDTARPGPPPAPISKALRKAPAKSPAKAPEKAPTKSPQNSSIWTCTLCTLNNPPSRTRCDACDSARPSLGAQQSLRPSASFSVSSSSSSRSSISKPGSSGSRSSGSSSASKSRKPSKSSSTAQMLERFNTPNSKQPDWSCHVCSTRNEHEFWSCSTCGWVKDKS
ncbi:WLM domain-containing protein [Pyronema domesticum]|uniref:Similar to DNA damage response protein WSS1 acc. no. P38838 n=1 Tax=Pyronema omphalodes (strain CBS 100304) TaxID=1076935 RepID=U4L9I9_PYROM|nr:WLM domain-containing protein [Pyronema domesticum]CCX06849.1 Similar to DNA damage response protein WSS1; acc. no. P38838 [Pyronema omphalodes CBS 100304]